MNAVTEAEIMAAAEPITGLRQPPQAVEAEQAVLGALLLDNLAWDHVADVLRAEDFFSSEHRVIFEAIAALCTACKPADVITVHDRIVASGDRMGEGVTLVYLNGLLCSVASIRMARAHAQLVRRKALQRALIATVDEAAALAWRGDQDPADQLHDIATRLDALQQGQLTQEPRGASELLVQRLDELNDAVNGNGPPPGWSTGLDDIDEALNGGLRPGRVYVIAARPSVGKTAFALQIGIRRARAGDGVLVLSQEMPSTECMDRIICNVGAVDYGRLQRQRPSDADWGGISAAADEIRTMPLWVDDEAALTLRQIRGKAMSVRRHGLKVLIVDYLQLCSGSGQRGVTRSSELGEISRGIKKLAKQLGIAVLLLSQLNRDVEKRSTPEPTLSDLRESGDIEQDADAVAFLFPVRSLGGKKIVGFSLAKHRQGEQRTRDRAIALEFHGWHQRWFGSDADITSRSAGNTKETFE